MRTDGRPVSHVDDEQLAAFIDGALSTEERAGVELHLAACDRCRMAFAEIARTVRELEAEDGQSARSVEADSVSREPAEVVPIAARPSPWMRWVYAGGGLAAAAALVLAVWWPRDERPELRELVEAVGDRRPVEGRLSGGFRFGPLDSTTRTASSDSDLSLLAARRKLEEEERAMSRGDARRLGALGVSYLVSREPGRAVAHLDTAVKLAADDALLLSDLSAALIALGDAQGDLGDYQRALANAETAMARRPQLAEALFNRALALERLNRRAEAERAWRAYLSVDGDSEWSRVAREHLLELGNAK